MVTHKQAFELTLFADYRGHNIGNLVNRFAIWFDHEWMRRETATEAKEQHKELWAWRANFLQFSIKTPEIMA